MLWVPLFEPLHLQFDTPFYVTIDQVPLLFQVGLFVLSGKVGGAL